VKQVNFEAGVKEGTGGAADDSLAHIYSVSSVAGKLLLYL